MNTLTRLLVTASAATLLLTTTLAEARMYRYKDENGQLVISNTVPQEATRRGYQVLNQQGRVIETIEPAPTAEEIAAREAREQREKEAAIQREKDRQLLKRYSHPDQAVRAMHRKVSELQGLIQLKRGNIAVIENQLNSEQSQAADLERAGREIPEAKLEKMRRLEARIREIEAEIATQQAEIENVREEFRKDIRRLEIVTDEPRTLPLDPGTASEKPAS